MLKSPQDTEFMAFLAQVCCSKDRRTLSWGETGPRLVAEAVERFHLQPFLQRDDVFCPVGWYEWDQVLGPRDAISLSPQTYAIHLWNEMWRRNGTDKNAAFHPDCLYERLKARYL